MNSYDITSSRHSTKTEAPVVAAKRAAKQTELNGHCVVCIAALTKPVRRQRANALQARIRAILATKQVTVTFSYHEEADENSGALYGMLCMEAQA
jgi:hypothetical protein